MRVLIVDDVAAVREALHLLLREEPGVAVVGEVADGAQSVQLSEELRLDLVLMDIEMPHMGGLAAIRPIRRRPNPPNIVAMSVYGASDSIRTSALDAGAATYVAKEVPWPKWWVPCGLPSMAWGLPNRVSGYAPLLVGSNPGTFRISAPTPPHARRSKITVFSG